MQIRERQKAAPDSVGAAFWNLIGDGSPSVYFSSFLGGLHFSHTLPSFTALTQQGCAQSLPAALAFSQQVSAKAGVARTANAKAAAMTSLVMFIRDRS